MDEKRLREILEEPFTDGWVKTIDAKITAIKALVLESVPKEKIIDYDKTLYYKRYDAGRNAAIQEIRKQWGGE